MTTARTPIDFSDAPLLNGKPLLTRAARESVCKKMYKDQSNKRAYKNAFTREQKEVANAPTYAKRKKAMTGKTKPLVFSGNRISKGINSRKLYYVTKPWNKGTYTRISVYLSKDYMGENVLKYIRYGQIRRVVVSGTAYGNKESKELMKTAERRIGVWSGKANHIMDFDIEKGPGWHIMTVSSSDLEVMRARFTDLVSKAVQGVINRRKAFAAMQAAPRYNPVIPYSSNSSEMNY